MAFESHLVSYTVVVLFCFFHCYIEIYKAVAALLFQILFNLMSSYSINTNKNFCQIKLSSKKSFFFENFQTKLLLDYWWYANTVKSHTHFMKAVLLF